MKKYTRDETEHGQEYYLASEVDKALAQPAQEPVAWMHEWADGERAALMNPRDYRFSDQPLTVRPLVYGDTTPQPAQPAPVQERNFCSRCGKRTADLTVIHTCTPPQENT